MIFSSVNGLSQFLNQNPLGGNQVPNPPTLQTQEVIKPQKITPQPKKSSPKSKEVQVGLTVQEKSWVRIVADGKIAYEGELPQGTQRTWKAQAELKIRAGNAGGVLLSINHEKAKQMGESGQVEERIIAAKFRS